MVEQVAIVGSGTLGNSLTSKLRLHCLTKQYTRDKIDLSKISKSKEYAKILQQYDKIVFVAGTFKGTTSDIFTVNALTPIQIIHCLQNLGWRGQVIVTGSTGATWTSWPGADLTRLAYNNSKRTLREWCLGFNQSQPRDIYITVIDPCRFQSPMSDYNGYPAEHIVEVYLDVLLKDRVLTQHIEMLNAVNDKAN